MRVESETCCCNVVILSIGAPGSCMRRFSTMPYLFCDSKNVCNVAQRTDYSYWLTTDVPMPQDVKFIPATDVAPYISR